MSLTFKISLGKMGTMETWLCFPRGHHVDTRTPRCHGKRQRAWGQRPAATRGTGAFRRDAQTEAGPPHGAERGETQIIVGTEPRVLPCLRLTQRFSHAKQGRFTRPVRLAQRCFEDQQNVFRFVIPQYFLPNKGLSELFWCSLCAPFESIHKRRL